MKNLYFFVVAVMSLVFFDATHAMDNQNEPNMKYVIAFGKSYDGPPAIEFLKQSNNHMNNALLSRQLYALMMMTHDSGGTKEQPCIFDNMMNPNIQEDFSITLLAYCDSEKGYITADIKASAQTKNVGTLEEWEKKKERLDRSVKKLVSDLDKNYKIQATYTINNQNP